MSKELDVQAVLAMGWMPRTVSEQPFGDGTFVVYDKPDRTTCMQPGVTHQFSVDIEKAYAMEGWIEDHNLKDQYAKSLSLLIDPSAQIFGRAVEMNPYEHDVDADYSAYDYVWLLIHASPEQRCLAFLEAMKGEENG